MYLRQTDTRDYITGLSMTIDLRKDTGASVILWLRTIWILQHSMAILDHPENFNTVRCMVVLF